MFLLVGEEIRIRTSKLRIRIQILVAQKHTDPERKKMSAQDGQEQGL
jgi:hypothetical protein